MNVTKVKIGKLQYNVAQASAEKQLELISMVGPLALMEIAKSGKEIDKNMIVGSLLTAGHGKLTEIADIVLYKTMLNGKDELVDISAFQGRMSDYLQLVAEAIIANLADFFGYLSSAASKDSAGQ